MCNVPAVLQVTVLLKLDTRLECPSYTLRNYSGIWSHLGLCAPWAQTWGRCGLSNIFMKSFTWQASQRSKSILSLRGEKLHSLVETVLTLELELGFEPNYLAGCSFGKTPISVSLWIFTCIKITLDLFHLPYRVDVNFLWSIKIVLLIGH